MPWISSYVMETVCTEQQIRATQEEIEALKLMSNRDARLWLMNQEIDSVIGSETVDSDAPHTWEDGNRNFYPIEEL